MLAKLLKIYKHELRNLRNENDKGTFQLIELDESFEGNVVSFLVPSRKKF